MPTHSRVRRGAFSALAVTAVAGLTFSGLPNGAAAPTSSSSSDDNTVSSTSNFTHSAKERKGYYDARAGSPKAQLREAREMVSARGKTFDAFTKKLGPQAIVDYDGVTGTPRNLARLDGFLTGPSSASARAVTMNYVRANLNSLGLTRSDLGTFTLRKDYRDIAGIHHLSYTQSVNGIQVFGNGLKANVTKNGQLLSIQGSPVSGLKQLASDAGTTPDVSASQARSAAASDVGGKAASANATETGGKTVWSNHDQAQLVYFATANGLRLGWSTYVQAGGDSLNYQHVIDAASGNVLYRHDSVNFDRGDALVYDNYPGAAHGGNAKVVNLIRAKYLKGNKTFLDGNYTIAFADINDDNEINNGETTPVPGAANGNPQFTLVPFNDANTLCSDSFVCTWDPNESGSWFTNKRADVTQGFYYNSLFHDYLKAAPFGFTAQAGNFEANGGDPVLLNSIDGANIDNGMPDGDHIDNANMNTPPDGVPPTMQMYLFHTPGATNAEDPFLPTSSSFDPSVIFHEYTHGLSNRLVVDAQGNSTLNGIQSGSMGEAWSDYYAMDNLVTKGFERDRARDGDVRLGKYVLANTEPFRTQAIDCPVDSTANFCSRLAGGTGGYTYGDFPIIGGTPEVHASGEVWAQTLWDLRTRVGHDVAGSVITRGMELAPNAPTMLDMRNAIVQADLAVYGGSHRNAIWSTFAHRGMGWFAGVIDDGDAFPAEDFHKPPSPAAPRATVSGQVTDGTTDEPVANALVAIGGHGSGFTGDYTAVTDGSGRYSIPNVFVGTYPKFTVFAPGFEVITQELEVTPSGATDGDFAPRRDWAATSGGGAVVDFNGPDFSAFGCGPGGAIDLSMGTGWGSTTGDNAGTPTNVMIPKHVTVELPTVVTITAFAVNPSNVCGDPGSSSTGDYRIETSPDGNVWTTVAEDTFTAADRGQLVDIDVADTPGVQFVKFTMLSPQVPDFATNCPLGAFGGCQFTDMTEIEAFGTE